MSRYSIACRSSFPGKIQFGFLPSLRLPREYAPVEHAFGDRDIVSSAYVGSSGQDLIFVR